MSLYETTVTSKGQITIPAALRVAWKLNDGDRVEFYAGADGEVFVRPLNAKPTAVFADFSDEVMVASETSDETAIAAAVLQKDSRTRRKRTTS